MIDGIRERTRTDVSVAHSGHPIRNLHRDGDELNRADPRAARRVVAATGDDGDYGEIRLRAQEFLLEDRAERFALS